MRYGALRQAVEAQAAHDAALVPCPLPYRTPELWRDLFYMAWSRERSSLALQGRRRPGRDLAARETAVAAVLTYPRRGGSVITPDHPRRMGRQRAVCRRGRLCAVR